VSDIQPKRLDAYTIDGDVFIALINEEEQYSVGADPILTTWRCG